MNTTNMTLEQARQTRWTFRDYRGQPMGELLDQGLLTLKDLGFAVERAYDKRVQEAAKILLLYRLEQVADKSDSPSGMVKVISGGRSFSQRGQMLYMLLQGVMFGFIMGGALILLVWDISSRSSRNPAETSETTARLFSMPPHYVLLTLAVALLIVVGIPALIFLGVNRATRYFDRQIDQHRLGQEGEERTVSVIQQALDGNWTAFLNVVLPGRKRTDLDIVLVGPTGVYVIEVKNLSGAYRNTGEVWEYQLKNRWRPANNSPSRQAQSNAVRLADFLKADGISQWVTPAIVWANPSAPIMVENPMVAVWTLDQLRDELGNLGQTNKVASPTREQIVEKLSKLCQKQADEQWYAKQ